MNSMGKVILTVAVTALIVGGSTYWYVNSKATTDKAALQGSIDSLNRKVADLTPATTSTVPTTSTTPSTIADPTADWKTFTSTKFGFSFKYPPTWKVTDGSLSGGDISLANTSKTYAIEGGAAYPIIVQVSADTSGGSIDKYLTGGRASLKSILKPGTVTLGGKTAYVLQGTTAPTYHDDELVFLNGYVYSFGNEAKVVTTTQTDIDSITKIYTELLTTVTFTK